MVWVQEGFLCICSWQICTQKFVPVCASSRDVPIRFFLPRSQSESFICRYRVPIRYSAWTNIALDNTAALRKKAPASKLFLNSFFFILLKQIIYFYTTLSYSAYAIATLASTFFVSAGESVTLHCDSRPSCTASWSMWDAAHAWYLHVIYCFLHMT